jgi:hypothetical protein
MYGISLLALIAYDAHPELIQVMQSLLYWKDARITIPYCEVKHGVNVVDRVVVIACKHM